MTVDTLSPTVEGVAKDLGESPVRAQDLVNAILARHKTDYASGEAAAIEVPWPETSATLAGTAWLTEAAALFRNDAFDTLHGRAVIVAAALLDPPSGRAMVESGLFYAVARELRPPLGEVLSPTGQERLALIPLIGLMAGVEPLTLLEPEPPTPAS